MEIKTINCFTPHKWAKLNYYEWSTRPSSKTVYCVHGLTRNGRDFDKLAIDLSNSARVICPDMLGRGKSDWLEDQKDYGYPLYNSCMGNLISTAIETNTIYWVGTSMGGIIGMHLAAAVYSPIKKLVLNDIGAVISRKGLQRIQQYVLNPPTSFSTFQEAVDYFKDIHQPFGLNDSEWEEFTKISVNESTSENGNKVFKLHYDSGIGHSFKEITDDIQLWHLWDNIKCEVMVIRGKNSDILSETILEQMKNRGPGIAKLLEIDNVGHAPMLHTPTELDSIREFLFGNQ